MKLNSNEYIRNKAERLTKDLCTRDPETIARLLGITICKRRFSTQKGAYVLIANNPYIFLKRDLAEPMRSIVILHEIGHDRLHRKQAQTFKEFNLFDKTGGTMEYEANLFAAHIMLPDDEVIDYIKQGYTSEQIAAFMNSDANLVALKAADLMERGLDLRLPEYKKNFL